MAYRIEWDTKAEKDFNTLDNSVKIQIKDLINNAQWG